MTVVCSSLICVRDWPAAALCAAAPLALASTSSLACSSRTLPTSNAVLTVRAVSCSVKAVVSATALTTRPVSPLIASASLDSAEASEAVTVVPSTLTL